MTRGKETLDLLSIYGPLSHRALLKMLNPPIKRKRLEAAIARLKRKGFVVLRNERVFGGHGAFYQLSQDQRDRIRIGKYLNRGSEEFKQPQFSYKELLHAETCAIWAHHLKALFPFAKIIRDYEIRVNEEAKSILQWSDKDRDLAPDLLLLLPNKQNTAHFSIALEVEKSRKSDERLLRKVSKYADTSLIDGVIYICETDLIANTIRDVYNSRVLSTAHRVKQYSDNFFMFSLCIEPLANNDFQLINTGLQNISAKMWISYLSETPILQRRNTISS